MRLVTYQHHFVTPDLLTKDFTQPESVIINEKTVSYSRMA